MGGAARHARHGCGLGEVGLSRREGREMLYRLGDSEECEKIHRAIDDLFHINCVNYSHC